MKNKKQNDYSTEVKIAGAFYGFIMGFTIIVIIFGILNAIFG